VKKGLALALGASGVLLLAWGISLDQSVVGKYRFYAVSAGYMLGAAAVLSGARRRTSMLLAPLVLGYLLVAYTFYVRARFPDNLIFRPSGYVTLWHVLMGNTIALTAYEPRPSLTVQHQEVMRARYPAIDMHFHLGSLVNVDADALVKAMDAAGIAKVVNLDGLPGDLAKFRREFHDKYPDRFVMFARLDLTRLFATADGIEKEAAALERAVRSGAAGLKVTKELGLKLRDGAGQLVAIDDPRLDPIWTAAGDLGVPVLLHVVDPTPFFDPVDRFNERYVELKQFPEWSYYGPAFPRKEPLLAQRENLLQRHPSTIIIGAHLGQNPDNLAYTGKLLDRYPNYYVDIAAVLPELGRQPFTAREFFVKYQDRILFASDGGFGLGGRRWPVERFFRTYFVFLETRNEYFEYPLWGIQKQGDWRIYGLDLPDDVLQKIYYRNAAHILRLDP